MLILRISAEAFDQRANSSLASPAKTCLAGILKLDGHVLDTIQN
jgi:hypothetical protein